jgi:hypothetical protein
MSRLLYDPITTNVDVNTSAAETTWASWVIPANTLKTNQVVKVTIIWDFLNNTGAGDFFTLRVKYGATTVFADASAAITAGAARRDGVLEFWLMGDTATNVQLLRGRMQLGAQSAATTGTGDLAGTLGMSGASWGGAAAEDSTADKTLAVTIQNNVNSINFSVRLLEAHIEVF